MMKAQVMTVEQMRECNKKDYNPQIWAQNIDSMLKYKDVVFYLVAKDEVYEYDRYFVEYTLPEGLRLFGSFGYSSSITNGGFFRLDKVNITSDGRDFLDAVKLGEENKAVEFKQLIEELENSGFFRISYGKFSHEDKMVVINTTKEARAWMTQRSIKYGLTFSKGN